jgi:serine/threonine protein kinase
MREQKLRGRVDLLEGIAVEHRRLVERISGSGVPGSSLPAAQAALQSGAVLPPGYLTSQVEDLLAALEAARASSPAQPYLPQHEVARLQATVAAKYDALIAVRDFKIDELRRDCEALRAERDRALDMMASRMRVTGRPSREDSRDLVASLTALLAQQAVVEPPEGVVVAQLRQELDRVHAEYASCVEVLGLSTDMNGRPMTAVTLRRRLEDFVHGTREQILQWRAVAEDAAAATSAATAAASASPAPHASPSSSSSLAVPLSGSPKAAPSTLVQQQLDDLQRCKALVSSILNDDPGAAAAAAATAANTSAPPSAPLSSSVNLFSDLQHLLSLIGNEDSLLSREYEKAVALIDAALAHQKPVSVSQLSMFPRVQLVAEELAAAREQLSSLRAKVEELEVYRSEYNECVSFLNSTFQGPVASEGEGSKALLLNQLMVLSEEYSNNIETYHAIALEYEQTASELEDRTREVAQLRVAAASTGGTPSKHDPAMVIRLAEEYNHAVVLLSEPTSSSRGEEETLNAARREAQAMKFPGTPGGWPLGHLIERAKDVRSHLLSAEYARDQARGEINVLSSSLNELASALAQSQSLAKLNHAAAQAAMQQAQQLQQEQQQQQQQQQQQVAPQPAKREASAASAANRKSPFPRRNGGLQTDKQVPGAWTSASAAAASVVVKPKATSPQSASKSSGSATDRLPVTTPTFGGMPRHAPKVPQAALQQKDGSAMIAAAAIEAVSMPSPRAGPAPPPQFQVQQPGPPVPHQQQSQSQQQQQLAVHGRVHRNKRVEDMYQMGEVLGTGSFAVVKHCVELSTGDIFAVKIVDKLRWLKYLDCIQREVDILMTLSHPNIILLHEVIDNPESLFMITELCLGGDLLDHIEKRGPLREVEAANVVLKTAEGIAYMHARGVVHRDLKPENILLGPRGPSDSAVKICDFGHSAFLSRSRQPSDEAFGTFIYLAPEVILTKTFDTPMDLWSLGVIMYIMFAGQFPFEGQNDEALFEEIVNGDYNFDDPLWRAVSPEAKDLISRLLNVNASERLTATQVLSHPWITSMAGTVAPLSQRRPASVSALPAPAPASAHHSQQQRAGPAHGSAYGPAAIPSPWSQQQQQQPQQPPIHVTVNVAQHRGAPSHFQSPPMGLPSRR